MEWSGEEERRYNNHDLLRGMRARMSSGIVKIAEVGNEGGGFSPVNRVLVWTAIPRFGVGGQSRAAFIAKNAAS